jgi:Raf kinase inhibitor-like YbhB/YbcL family protein
MRISAALALAFSISATAAMAQAPAAPPAPPPMVLTSTAFPDGGVIPLKYSQAQPGTPPGEGTSPALNWTNVPPAAKSLVLHMRDLDVARNKTTEDQLHWLVWGMKPSVTSLAEGAPKGAKLPDGSWQVSATGPMYRGPGASAAGPLHHYMFEIYALDIELNVEPTADMFGTRAKVLAAMQGHIIGKAVYGGLFKRPN